MTFSEILHVCLHSLLDVAKILPFLFLTYLLMEWMEHRMQDKTRHAVEKAGKFGPLMGGIAGAVPQCGFSAAASGLYAGRVISLGTLFSVFLSTSDEMLPIAIGHLAQGEVAPLGIVRLLIAKVAIGMFWGFLVDLILKKRTEEHHHHIGEMCENHRCGCEKGIVRSSIIHTLEVAIFIFLVTFALDTVVEWVGEDVLASVLSKGGYFTCFLASLVGLIPNCAASVVITELYLQGALTTGALYAGLLTGAGVGILILFRVNRPHKSNVWIALSLFGMGGVTGVLIDLLGLDFLGLKY